MTSIESYREAHASGLIGERQMQVLQFIIEFGSPVSQGDCGRHYADASSSFQPRFRELEDSGLIRQCGTKNDPVTGRKVKAYVPTGAIPTEPVRRKSKKVRATLQPVGDLFRVTFDPPMAIDGAMTFLVVAA